MDLLTNAVESIQVGIADYTISSRPRLLSAVRNLHAGIMLLYKEALRRRSDPDSNEALLKARIRPVQLAEEQVAFVGVGKRTADVRTIKERFESLGISTDWERFRRVSEIRNDVEHYFPKASAESLKELVASAFWIIRSFVIGELQSDPSALLGRETWKAMLEVAEVYEAERLGCDAALEKIEWESPTLAEGVKQVRCNSCGSDLLRPGSLPDTPDDKVLSCTVCGSTMDSSIFVPAAVSSTLAIEKYFVYDDGADEPYVECPECGLETYVEEEQRCALCGASVEVTDCARCGKPIPPSELSFSPLCSYCDQIMSKED